MQVTRFIASINWHEDDFSGGGLAVE